MSMLDRYKKSSAAIMELVKLIEDSPEPKRGNLLRMIRAEDEAFADRVEKRVIDWPKFRTLDDGILAEAVGSCPAKVVAMATLGEEEAFVRVVERCLGNKFSEYRQEKELYKTTPPNAGQIDSARKKMISEARKLETDGALKLMNYEQIDSETSVAAGNASPGKLNMDGATASGSAKEDDGVPEVESFGIEPAPAGLLGERLEVYLKKELGI
jgi:flagellar motor switch protein FliG